ncbi:hypothetical protein R5W23_005220 [Gemmata sp. JC673]|uniref:Uncharacterized protein n=1 Tax=Gemmata algarum TaxID=2975278 RepID=A0ABU5FCR2_9BACT|nr:hypothetical protein [Gemmata algarum]MDY3563606.1 hypothetical protein [Gemmata algarum]
MFKSVQYAGFEDRPELRARAEQLETVLADEVTAWRGDVEVRWAPAADPEAVLDLTLAITRPNGVAARHTGTFVPGDFSHPRWLASRCNRVWFDLLGALLDQQHQRVEAAIPEPVEA